MLTFLEVYPWDLYHVPALGLYCRRLLDAEQLESANEHGVTNQTEQELLGELFNHDGPLNTSASSSSSGGGVLDPSQYPGLADGEVMDVEYNYTTSPMLDAEQLGMADVLEGQELGEQFYGGHLHG
jgi:hypothetical protein